MKSVKRFVLSDTCKLVSRSPEFLSPCSDSPRQLCVKVIITQQIKVCQKLSTGRLIDSSRHRRENLATCFYFRHSFQF